MVAQRRHSRVEAAVGTTDKSFGLIFARQEHWSVALALSGLSLALGSRAAGGLLCCKNEGELYGPFDSYWTVDHSFCHVSAPASITPRLAFQIPTREPVSHWRALHSVPPAAALPFCTDELCCAAETLCSLALTAFRGSVFVDLPICVHHWEQNSHSVQMSSASTSLRTVDVLLLRCTTAQHALLNVGLAESSLSPFHPHSKPVHLCSVRKRCVALSPFGKPRLPLSSGTLTRAGEEIQAPKPK